MISRKTFDVVGLELPCWHLPVKEDVKFLKRASHGFRKAKGSPDEAQCGQATKKVPQFACML